MARLILPRANPFVFPGGNPGFDPTHIALAGLGAGVGKKKLFSGVSIGGNFINLLDGSKGNIAGSPTANIVGTLGPATNCPTGNDGINFTGQSTAAATSITFAGIFVNTASNAGAFSNSLVATVTNFNSVSLSSAGSALVMQINNTGVSSGFIPALNVPYFFICSNRSGTGGIVNFLLMNLQTGQIQTSSSAATAAAAASGGSFFIGYNATATVTDALKGSIAAAAYIPKYTSLQQMRQWAQDPWAFWYPRKIDFAQMLTAPSGGGNVFNDSVTEAATASDAETVVATFAATSSETGIAADSPSVGAVFATSDTEAATATDTPTAGTSTTAAITEAATATETEASTATFAASQAEAGTATDLDVAIATFSASQTEAGSATDSDSASAVFAASDTEVATATDSETTSIDGSVTESATATETETATVVFAAAAAEACTATDAPAVTAIFTSQATEAGSAIDAPDSTAVFVASDTEAATASDASNGVIPGPPPLGGDVHSSPFFATPGSLTSLP